MKNRWTILGCMLVVAIHTYAQDVEYIIYNENYQSYPSSIQNVPLRAKSLRKADNRGGQISINYISPVPDSLKQAIEIATLLWEECLPVETKFTINVSFDSNATDMSVNVPHVVHTNDTLYTTSYYKTYISNNFVSLNDGVVVFSNAVNWCCQYSQENSGNMKCLSTAMLRAIARVLGFGSTVQQNEQGSVYFGYSAPGYTPFEYMIFNDTDIPLSSIVKGSTKRDNQALHSYSESGSLWLKWGANQYKLFAPTTFARDSSLNYLDTLGCLMHYIMPAGSKYLNIDSITRTVIQAIGWNVASSPSINIYCQNIPSTGIASAYNPYVFGISNYVSEMSSLRWEYLVKSANGDYQIVSQQLNGQTFLVTPSTYLSLSHINPEGDIDAMVRLKYILNNEEKTAFLKLTFECAPKILSINDESIHDNGYSTLYDYSFNVSYRGATSITIGVEQEYSPYYDIIHINEPFLAHAYLRYLSKGNMVWVDVSVSNEYGSDLQTIEIPMQSVSQVKEESPLNINAIIKENNIGYIDIYSVNGSFLKRIKCISELSSYHSCTLLLQYFSQEHQLICSRKIQLK